jgi:hypothetical protein
VFPLSKLSCATWLRFTTGARRTRSTTGARKAPRSPRPVAHVLRTSVEPCWTPEPSHVSIRMSRRAGGARFLERQRRWCSSRWCGSVLTAGARSGPHEQADSVRFLERQRRLSTATTTVVLLTLVWVGTDGVGRRSPRMRRGDAQSRPPRSTTSQHLLSHSSATRRAVREHRSGSTNRSPRAGRQCSFSGAATAVVNSDNRRCRPRKRTHLDSRRRHRHPLPATLVLTSESESNISDDADRCPFNPR